MASTLTACRKSPGCLAEDGHSGLCRFVSFGEAEGWRAWNVIGPPAKPRLQSAYGHTKDPRHAIWPTNAWMIARCPHAPDEEVEAAIFYASHHTPEPDCSCGIYAANSRESLHAAGSYHAYTRSTLTVTGRCGLAGRVIEAWCGFRAEKARIIELYVPASRWHYAEALRDAYGAEVILDNTWADVVSDNATRLPGRRP